MQLFQKRGRPVMRDSVDHARDAMRQKSLPQDENESRWVDEFAIASSQCTVSGLPLGGVSEARQEQNSSADSDEESDICDGSDHCGSEMVDDFSYAPALWQGHGRSRMHLGMGLSQHESSFSERFIAEDFAMPVHTSVPDAAMEDAMSDAQVSGQGATFDASQYTRWVKTYDSTDNCLQQLGGRKFCKGHCARAVKKAGQITHLRCRLRSSNPPCQWAAILKEAADGSAQLLHLPSERQEHNEASPQQGKQGFEDLAERQQLDVLLRQTATSRPQRALRQARLEKKPVVKAQLKQVQRLRKQIVKEERDAKIAQLEAQLCKATAAQKAAKRRSHRCRKPERLSCLHRQKWSVFVASLAKSLLVLARWMLLS